MSLSLLAALLVLAAPAGMGDLRTRRDQVDQQQSALEIRVGAQQAELEAVSKRIDELKSQRQGSDSPFVSGNLDGLLKQSQSLSQSLADLRAQSAQVRAQQDEARSDLAHAVEARLASDRAALSTSSAAPEGLVAEIRSLEAERASLAANGSTGAGSSAVRFTGRTDDPRELRERADALRDRADKLAKEEARVEARLQELRDQAELDRQLRSVSRQDALFDEGDAKIQVQHVSTPTANPAVDATVPATLGNRRSPLYTGGPLHLPVTSPTPTAISTSNTLQDGSETDNPVLHPPTGNSEGIESPAHENTGVDSAAANTATNVTTAQGALVRPEDFGTQASAPLPPIDESSVESLKAARAQLVQQTNQLRQQAAALDAQAAQGK